MEKRFIRIRSTKDLIISVSIAIAGAILIALPTSVSINLVGFFMIFAGIIMLLFMKTGYKDVQTGTRYSKKESFYPQSMRADIETCLESGKGKSRFRLMQASAKPSLYIWIRYAVCLFPCILHGAAYLLTKHHLFIYTG